MYQSQIRSKLYQSAFIVHAITNTGGSGMIQAQRNHKFNMVSVTFRWFLLSTAYLLLSSAAIVTLTSRCFLLSIIALLFAGVNSFITGHVGHQSAVRRCCHIFFTTRLPPPGLESLDLHIPVVLSLGNKKFPRSLVCDSPTLALISPLG